MTSQYQGGWVAESQAIGSTPNQPSTVLASPNRTPLKIDIFQTSDATTYEQAVGRKNTDRKNACAPPDAVDQQRQPQGQREGRRHDERREDDEGEQAAEGRRVAQHVGVVAEPDEVGRA